MKIDSVVQGLIGGLALLSLYGLLPVQVQAQAQGPSYEVRLVAESSTSSSGRDSNLGDIKVLSDSDWRSRDAEIPWSRPVMVRDDFDGDYLAVFDRNFTRTPTQEQGVISNWSRNYIRIYVYNNTRVCGLLAVVCRVTQREALEAKTLDIRIGDKVFNLSGTDGNFPVSSDLAQALSNAPSGDARIRISLEGSGATIVSDIGSKTVDAWKVVYGSEASTKGRVN